MAFMSCLPMTLGNGLDVDLKRMKRLRTMLTTTAANLAPLQGEFLGGAKPHLMFHRPARTALLLVTVREQRGQPQRGGVRQVGLGASLLRFRNCVPHSQELAHGSS